MTGRDGDTWSRSSIDIPAYRLVRVNRSGGKTWNERYTTLRSNKHKPRPSFHQRSDLSSHISRYRIKLNPVGFFDGSISSHCEGIQQSNNPCTSLQHPITLPNFQASICVPGNYTSLFHSSLCSSRALSYLPLTHCELSVLVSTYSTNTDCGKQEHPTMPSMDHARTQIHGYT